MKVKIEKLWREPTVEEKAKNPEILSVGNLLMSERIGTFRLSNKTYNVDMALGNRRIFFETKEKRYSISMEDIISELIKTFKKDEVK